MKFTVEAWTKGWRAWIALNANELAWTFLAIGGVLFTALLMHP